MFTPTALERNWQNKFHYIIIEQLKQNGKYIFHNRMGIALTSDTITGTQRHRNLDFIIIGTLINYSFQESFH